MKHINKLLKVADGVYPDGLIERLRKGEEEVGDGLVKFIFNEMNETAEGRTPREITESVIKALETGARELDSVIRALRQVNTKGPKRVGPRKRLKEFTVYWERQGSKVYKATSEEDAQEQFSNDPNAPDEEQTTDVYTQEGRDL